VRRATPDEFVSEAVGRYLPGRSWVCFHAGPVSGAILWGHVELDDARVLLDLAPATHTEREVPHVVLWEARDVTIVDTGVFPLVASYIAEHSAAILAKLTRFALVHPDDLPSVVAAGFLDAVPGRVPRRAFPDRQSALAWLGVETTAEALAAAERVARKARTGGSYRLQLGPEARWFRFAGADSQVVSLQRHRAPRLMLVALARARLATPGESLTVQALFEVGWPGQAIRADSAAHRVYVALSTLRARGLRDVLIGGAGGYHLRSDVTVAVEAGSARARGPRRL
jgi:hypothetical protein